MIGELIFFAGLATLVWFVWCSPREAAYGDSGMYWLLLVVALLFIGWLL